MSYDEETHNKHCAETREIMNSIPKNNVIFWCTDNNGQITQDKDNYEQIGEWAIGNKTEEGNGKQLGEICKEYDLICSNNFFKPKRGIKEKLATWYSHNGEIKRQIDYFNITKTQELDTSNNKQPNSKYKTKYAT